MTKYFECITRSVSKCFCIISGNKNARDYCSGISTMLGTKAHFQRDEILRPREISNGTAFQITGKFPSIVT